jgi:hypothetical protein
MDALGLYDIYGFYHVPFWQTGVFKYGISISLVVVLLTCICYFLYRRRYKKIPETPLQIIHKELAALRLKIPIQKTYSAQWYAQLTYIIKRLLQLHGYNHCMSMTDDEIATIIRKKESCPDALLPIINLLHTAQDYKFNTVLPSAEQQLQDIYYIEQVMHYIATQLQNQNQKTQ